MCVWGSYPISVTGSAGTCGGKRKNRFFFGIVQKDCVLTMFLAVQKSNFDMHCELFDYNELDMYSGF